MQVPFKLAIDGGELFRRPSEKDKVDVKTVKVFGVSIRDCFGLFPA